ncbi:hypothetical protein ACX9NE_12215 [Mycobacterium sp. ML4]
MQSVELRVDADCLSATVSQWHGLSTQLGILAPPSPGRPCQPSAAAVSGVHAGVDRGAAALTARIQATAGAVAAGAAGYVDNEAMAAAEFAAVPQHRVV